MTRPRPAYPPIADQQSGAFTSLQARAAGFSPRDVSYRLQTGRWVRVAGRAMRHRDQAETTTTLLHAAGLTWPDGIVCGALAAKHWGSVVAVGEVDVIVPAQRRRLHRLRPHRSLVPPGDGVRWGEIRVMAPGRSDLDALARLPLDDARDLLAWLVTRRRLAVTDLETFVGQRPGRWGNAQLRRLARESREGALSAAEALCHEIFRRARIRGWEANATLRDTAGIIGVVDVLFRERRLAIEIDGRRAHGAERVQHDRDRQNRIVAAGYRVLRFTWHDLVDRPHVVVAQTRTMLR